MKTYYDGETAAKAVEEFDTIFRKKDIPDEIPEVEMSEESMKLVDLLTNYGLAETKSNARRLIEQGAVNVNGLKLTDVNHVMEITHGMIFKVGKRKFLKILKQQTN